MTTQGHVLRDTWAELNCTRLQTLPFYRSVGVLQNRTHLMVSMDNEARLAWLERALDYAFLQRRPELWSYLEAVMDEVLFEIELDPK